MVAGMELEKYSAGHEMLNQQCESLPQHKPEPPWEN